MEVNARLLEYSRRLPPPDAWRQPDTYLNLETGLRREDSPRFEVILDDRDFVKPDETVAMLADELFWPDYEWTYDNRDPELQLDKHHFHHRARNYDADQFDGSEIPYRFRNIPTLIGLMPRQMHNVIHDFTREPKVPEFEQMAHYVESYGIAHRAFSRLIESAANVTTASRLFAIRQESLLAHAVEPSYPDDRIAREMMINFFDKHFKEYGRAIGDVLLLDGTDFAMNEREKALLAKPHLVARRVGHIATRNCINLLPQLQAA